MNSKQKPDDVFARIAAQAQNARKNLLIEPQPPQLPNRALPGMRPNRRAVFQPQNKLNDSAGLRRELLRQRKRHAHFTRHLPPQVESGRIRLNLDRFDWRLETPADRRDFAHALNGRGQWNSIRIPHYGGPIGRATAFYRTTFQVTRRMLGQGSLFACFQGVDYKANVFVNGTHVGSHEGFFAPFELEFTGAARLGRNILLIQVDNDAIPLGNESWGQKQEGDKIYAATGLGWNDPESGWHHCPPGMGIYNSVTIEARPTIHLRDIFVRPIVAEKRAEAWIEVFNGARNTRDIHFILSVFGQNFSKTVFRKRRFAPEQQSLGPGVNCFRFSFPIPDPRLWEPDTPWLYQIQVKLPNGDGRAAQFGMRSFEMDASRKPYGRLLLNGREVRLRGANTMGFEQQDVLKKDWSQLRDDILLAKICHMNFWRITQRPVQREVYDMCDQLGLMTQTDLPLFGMLPRSQFCEAVRQAGEMERLVRSHPCNIMVSYINEPLSVALGGNKAPRHCTRFELERFFEAADQAVLMANPDRAIKPVDGDYEPPAPGLPDNHCYCCWYNGHGLDIGKLHKGYWQRVKPDWLYGCGEFGAEGLDSVRVMRKYYPKSWLPQSSDEEALWSPDRIKDAQTGKFHYNFFDTQRTLAGWVAASQRHQAWATQIMTEAFRRDNRMNSIAIHLFIDAWPAGWMKAIMDVDRQPKPAFFAYREALTPLMVNIRADRFAYTVGETMRFEFWVCNDTQETPAGAQLRYQFEIGGKVVLAMQAEARIETCRSTFQGFAKLAAPPVATRTQALLRLALTLPDGKVMHDTSAAVTLFPSASRRIAAQRCTAIVGKETGKAVQLSRQLGLRAAKSGNLFLVDDIKYFAKRRKEIETAVRNGATAVFLELPAGEYFIGGGEIKVDPCGMRARHFVSRNTGHPLAAEFQAEDFRLWYDPSKDRIAPFLETTFIAKDWTPILTSGNGGWSNAKWITTLAAAEKRDGQGVWRICNLKLVGRIPGNPVAERFARSLLSV